MTNVHSPHVWKYFYILLVSAGTSRYYYFCWDPNKENILEFVPKLEFFREVVTLHVFASQIRKNSVSAELLQLFGLDFESGTFHMHHVTEPIAPFGVPSQTWNLESGIA
jgi:hypothetical protein